MGAARASFGGASRVSRRFSVSPAVTRHRAFPPSLPFLREFPSLLAPTRFFPPTFPPIPPFLFGGRFTAPRGNRFAPLPPAQPPPPHPRFPDFSGFPPSHPPRGDPPRAEPQAGHDRPAASGRSPAGKSDRGFVGRDHDSAETETPATGQWAAGLGETVVPRGRGGLRHRHGGLAGNPRQLEFPRGAVGGREEVLNRGELPSRRIRRSAASGGRFIRRGVSPVRSVRTTLQGRALFPAGRPARPGRFLAGRRDDSAARAFLLLFHRTVPRLSPARRHAYRGFAAPRRAPRSAGGLPGAAPLHAAAGASAAQFPARSQRNSTRPPAPGAHPRGCRVPRHAGDTTRGTAKVRPRGAPAAENNRGSAAETEGERAVAAGFEAEILPCGGAVFPRGEGNRGEGVGGTGEGDRVVREEEIGGESGVAGAERVERGLFSFAVELVRTRSQRRGIPRVSGEYEEAAARGAAHVERVPGVSKHGNTVPPHQPALRPRRTSETPRRFFAGDAGARPAAVLA